MINKTNIKKLGPCQNRFDNYVKHYGSRSFTKKQFMALKKITHEDKMWVAFRLMPQEQVVKAVVEIANSVLSIFEAKYPGETRPREAVEAAEAWCKDPTEANANAASHAASAASYATDAATAQAAYQAALAAAKAAYAAYAASAAPYAAQARAQARAAASYAAEARAAAALAASYATDAAYCSTLKASVTHSDPYALAASAREKKEKEIRRIILRCWGRA